MVLPFYTNIVKSHSSKTSKTLANHKTNIQNKKKDMQPFLCIFFFGDNFSCMASPDAKD